MRFKVSYWPWFLTKHSCADSRDESNALSQGKATPHSMYTTWDLAVFAFDAHLKDEAKRSLKARGLASMSLISLWHGMSTNTQILWRANTPLQVALFLNGKQQVCQTIESQDLNKWVVSFNAQLPCWCCPLGHRWMRTTFLLCIHSYSILPRRTPMELPQAREPLQRRH